MTVRLAKASNETAPRHEETARSFDAARIRRDFPLLSRQVNGKPLVYLDNAATTQKPQAVIDALVDYYSRCNSNVHRGVHTLSQEATDLYEAARRRAADFIGAPRPEQIIFVRGATEAINLVAQAYTRPQLKTGDEILITAMEHHSNIVPWQMICEQTGARLRVAPITDAGELSLDDFKGCLNARTRLVAVVHVSNALGTINPIKEIVDVAHAQGIPVLVDGAQAAAHVKVNVAELGCDFYAFSGHKVYGPTGIGVLYGRKELLEAMPPYQGGGDMIASVTFENTVYNHLPYKFEAGTPNIAGAIGLGAALQYLQRLDWTAIQSHEHDLLEYGTRRLADVPGLRLIGTAEQKTAILSFILDDVHPHDIGTILDQQGIAIRTGHHCAQPLMDRFAVPATARASLALYNTRQDLDALVDALHEVSKVFQ